MWVYVFDESIPTYGKDGKKFLLNLYCKKYYGHDVAENYEVVTGIWDSLNECFYEEKTHMEIDNRDIVEWWKDV